MSKVDSEVERLSLLARRDKLRAEVASLPPREQLRLAADFAEKGQVKWAIQIAERAVLRLKKGETP